MQTRELGWTGLKLSVVGLGTAPAGGGGWKGGWGPQDDRESISVIHRSQEVGINWIDTAPIYGRGHSEEVVGRALKAMREKPVVATKCGMVWDKEGRESESLKRISIRSELEASLGRLKVDAIDLYQIHWPIPEEDIEEAWDTVGELIREGKVRYAGVSNFKVKHLKRIQPIHPVASLQSPYSMIERGIESSLLDYCSANNIGVVVYRPLQAGILAGKFTKERMKSLPGEDLRHQEPHFREPELSVNLTLAQNLGSLAKRRGASAAQLGVAWSIRRPEVTAAIVGARRPSQIEETAQAGESMLGKEDLRVIDSLLGDRERALEST